MTGLYFLFQVCSVRGRSTAGHAGLRRLLGLRRKHRAQILSLDLTRIVSNDISVLDLTVGLF